MSDRNQRFNLPLETLKIEKDIFTQKRSVASFDNGWPRITFEVQRPDAFGNHEYHSVLHVHIHISYMIISLPMFASHMQKCITNFSLHIMH